MTSLSKQFARRAEQLLGDGQWHPYEPTVRDLIRLVPPGMALRRHEKDRRHNYTSRGMAPDAPLPAMRTSTESRIRSGARSVVREFLKNRKLFETNQPGNPTPGGNIERLIRLTGASRFTGALGNDTQLSALELRNQHLEDSVKLLLDQIRQMQDYLRGIGAGDAADRFTLAWYEEGRWRG